MEHFKQVKYRRFGILRISPGVKCKWLKRRTRLWGGMISWGIIAVSQELLKVWDNSSNRESRETNGRSCTAWMKVAVKSKFPLVWGWSWAKATCSGGKHFSPMPILPLPYSSLLGKISKDANNAKDLWASFKIGNRKPVNLRSPNSVLSLLSFWWLTLRNLKHPFLNGFSGQMLNYLVIYGHFSTDVETFRELSWGHRIITFADKLLDFSDAYLQAVPSICIYF